MGDYKWVPGFGYVSSREDDQAPLRGDDSIMMISGLGAAEQPKYATKQSILTSTAASPFELLRLPSTFFGITLPLWVWAAVLAGALGAGYIFFRKKGLF